MKRPWNILSPDFLGSWLKAPHQVLPWVKGRGWSPHAEGNSPWPLPLDLWCPDFHDPLSQVSSQPWALLLTQLFFTYFYLNTFNFTPIHKNKIKSKCITGLVWKVNIKIHTMKRWPLNVNVHPLYQPNPRAHHQAYVFHPLGRTVPGTGAGDVCSSLCQEHTSLPQMRKKKNFIVLFFQTVPIVSSKQPLFRLNSKIYPKERDSNEWIGILYCLIQDPCWSSKETQNFPHPALSFHPLKESLLCLKDVELAPKGRN